MGWQLEMSVLQNKFQLETVLEIEKWISCFGESVHSATLFQLSVLPKEETNQILVYSPRDDPIRRCHLMSNNKQRTAGFLHSEFDHTRTKSEEVAIEAPLDNHFIRQEQYTIIDL